MRIKIIGDNNCARATRHLLRMAGFAVTDFLPVEAITHAPHSGYAIMIDLAPAAHPLNSPGEISGGFPTSEPDHATHGQTALGEVSPLAGGASSRLSVRPDGELGAARRKGAETEAVAGAETAARKDTERDPFVRSETAVRKGRQTDPVVGSETAVRKGRQTDPVVGSETAARKGRQAEACPTGGGRTAGHIRFDSVDSLLEAAVLRHVTRLSGGPVIVDRPGGLVHSERELRIVVPVSGDSKMDEAAVAVEFGVLRGLLELTSPAFAKAPAGTPAAFAKASAGKPAGSASASSGRPAAFASSFTGASSVFARGRVLRSVRRCLLRSVRGRRGSHLGATRTRRFL